MTLRIGCWGFEFQFFPSCFSHGVVLVAEFVERAVVDPHVLCSKLELANQGWADDMQRI